MAKILHTADFHLDSAFTALPEEKARLRRQEARQLTDRLVDYANDPPGFPVLLTRRTRGWPASCCSTERWASGTAVTGP